MQTVNHGKQAGVRTLCALLVLLVARVTPAEAQGAADAGTPAPIFVTGTPPSPEAVAAMDHARALYEAGDDLKAARAAVDEALRLRPDYAQAYLYRALITLEFGQLKDAEPDFEFALKLAPGTKEIHRHYGQALAGVGEIARAEAQYQQALAIDPGYAEVMFLMGVLHRKKNDLDTAVSWLEKHAAKVPAGASHHELGEIFLLKGDTARAAKEFEADLDTDATCGTSRLNLAGILLDDKRYAEARDHFEQSLVYHPADARALAGLGRAYLGLGDHELALGNLRSAQLLSPGDRMVEADISAARSRLRLSYGWPFAAVPGVIALGLLAYVVVLRRKYVRERGSRRVAGEGSHRG
jgi:tetratricopeptide (TPR) repeat protein